MIEPANHKKRVMTLRHVRRGRRRWREVKRDGDEVRENRCRRWIISFYSLDQRRAEKNHFGAYLPFPKESTYQPRRPTVNVVKGGA